MTSLQVPSWLPYALWALATAVVAFVPTAKLQAYPRLLAFVEMIRAAAGDAIKAKAAAGRLLRPHRGGAPIVRAAGEAPGAAALAIAAATRPVVAFLNRSTAMTDQAIQAMLPALQKQISRDFAPIWGIDAELVFVPKGQKIPQGAWWLVFLDTSDEAGALGYHDLTPQGYPLGKVFVKTVQSAGEEISVTASHELLEMLADPWGDFVVLVEDQGRIYMLEVADACEADALAYAIDGVKVSDFVTRSWFQPHAPRGARFDFLGHINKPFQILDGGYIAYLDLKTGRWNQEVVGRMTAAVRPRVGSRRERRMVGRAQWQTSTGE